VKVKFIEPCRWFAWAIIVTLFSVTVLVQWSQN